MLDLYHFRRYRGPGWSRGTINQRSGPPMSGSSSIDAEPLVVLYATVAGNGARWILLPATMPHQRLAER